MSSRRVKSATQHHRGRGNRTGGRSKKSPVIYIVLSLIALGAIGFGIYKLFSSTSGFDREILDRYVDATRRDTELSEDGFSVYFDMSDGMNFAYDGDNNRRLLQSIVNKLAANKGARYYGLADLAISPIEKSHTELYNYLLNTNNYDKQKAPIGDALQRIVEEKRPAVLLSDFEEYKGNGIEQAAYAKEYFIDWLKAGFYIAFYRWDFIEKGKQKHMFVAVFDDNKSELKNMVEDAIKTSSTNVDQYVLGGHNFRYPLSFGYRIADHGGNYVDSNGEDLVTGITTGKGNADYHSYAQSVATAGGAGNYLTLDWVSGESAEFYPLNVSWANAISNAKAYSDEAVPAEDRFSHFLSNLYVNFNAQSGYIVDDIEVRVFDIQQALDTIAIYPDLTGPDLLKAINSVPMPEMNLVLTASVNPSPESPQLKGYTEIMTDFYDGFNGTFKGDFKMSDLLRADIVIADAVIDDERAREFFGWEGNESLANSVIQTLHDKWCSPVGQVLFTYYLKSLAE